MQTETDKMYAMLTDNLIKNKMYLVEDTQIKNTGTLTDNLIADYWKKEDK